MSINTDQRRQHNLKQHVVVGKYDHKTHHHCRDHDVGPVVAILSTIGQYQRISQRAKLAVTQPGNIEQQRHHGQLTQPKEPLVPADAHVHVLEAETQLVAEDQEQTHKQQCHKCRKEVEGVITKGTRISDLLVVLVLTEDVPASDSGRKKPCQISAGSRRPLFVVCEEKEGVELETAKYDEYFFFPEKRHVDVAR